MLDALDEQRFIDAIRKIHLIYMDNFTVFGSAAIATTKEWPYIRNVPHEELIAMPELHRSSGDFA